MTCMLAGQPQVARWQQEHAPWRVRRWHCGVVSQLGEADL